MYLRNLPAPDGLQPVELGLFVVMCFGILRKNSCMGAAGGTMGLAACSMRVGLCVLLISSSSRCGDGLLATASWLLLCDLLCLLLSFLNWPDCVLLAKLWITWTLNGRRLYPGCLICVND